MDELIRELKAEGVLRSPYVEAAFRAIDRADFVRPQDHDQAYANYPLPIGSGQTISQPYTVAFMLDLLDPRPGEKILDIGAGSGWQTALLAHTVSQPEKGGRTKNEGKVYAVERIPELYRFATANLEKYNFIKKRAIEFFCRDATAGLEERSPFEKIIVAAAAAKEIPETWRRQLKIGGKIVAPVGDSIWLLTKTGEEEWHQQEFPGFAFVPLVAGTDARGTKHVTRPGSPTRRWNMTLLFVSCLALLVAWSLTPVWLQTNTTLEIPSGAGSRAIGELLLERGLIRSKWAFVISAALIGRAGDLKAGSYTFQGRFWLPEVVRRLARGERYPNERQITIPEGWDSRDIGRELEAQGIASAEEWFFVVGHPAADHRARSPGARRPDFSAEFPFLADKPAWVGLEGYLFPDTYRLFRDSPPESLVRKMLSNFEAKLTPELGAEIERQDKTIFSIITMASLLEKEVRHERERRIVAGILWKRLSSGIPLQVDASVNYITAKRATPTAEDLALDSPFITYRYPGLPRGPIANPGLGAILDALHPEPSPYLYYLSSADGGTIFSRTLEEHARARAEHLGR